MVVVCTVSYNSSDIIKKTIDALFRQSYPVDRIIIADNCSDEINRNKLSSYKDQCSKIDILWLKSNGGGAGGFYEAMKYAKEQYQPEWYWLMDDDAYPNDDCLEILIKKQQELRNVGFIAPVIWGIDNKRHQLYHARITNKQIYRFKSVATTFSELNEVEKLDVDAFVGPLISSSAVNMCGLPKPGYFLEGDDMDYTFRITRVLNGYLIRDAQINHRDLIVNNSINPQIWWKQYYSSRNPILFAYNNLIGQERTNAIIVHIVYIIKQIVKMFVDSRYSGYRRFRAKLLMKGLFDGLAKKDGIVIQPVEYKKALTILEEKKKNNHQ